MKAAFIDRDGVINVDKGYLFRIRDFEYQNGVLSFLKMLQKKSFSLFIITNQSGIGRGIYTETDMKNLHKWLISDLRKYGIDIEQIKFCPHLPSENCNCRKPKTGMIQQILNSYPNIELDRSILIGDKNSDIQCGKNAGVKFNFKINTETFDTSDQFSNIAKQL